MLNSDLTANNSIKNSISELIQEMSHKSQEVKKNCYLHIHIFKV